MNDASVAVHAVFDTTERTRQALASLAAAGIDPARIEVRSSVPLGDDIAPPGAAPRSRVPLLACTGGLIGAAAAYLLATVPATLHPFPTGGMPTVALPTVGVIVFEGTAIGAILATVATVLWECGIPQRPPHTGPFDAEIAAGYTVVRVAGSTDVPPDWTTGARAASTVGPQDPEAPQATPKPAPRTP